MGKDDVSTALYVGTIASYLYIIHRLRWLNFKLDLPTNRIIVIKITRI